MRPTYLQFRSPKEQTGEYLNVNVTSDGKSLKYKAKEAMKSTWSKGQRWEHIKEVARRTSYKVGPGCYNFAISTNRGRGAVIVKDQANAAPINGNFDYIYVGDTLMKRERPASRGGLSPRSMLYNTERNMSPVASQYGGHEGTFAEQSGRNSLRAMSAGRRSDYQIGGESPYSSKRLYPPSYTYQQNGGNSPTPAKKKVPSYNYHVRGGSYSPSSRQYERQLSGGQSPDNEPRYRTTASPENRRSHHNSARDLRGDEGVHVKDKDFYAALQDQWQGGQKIVIHRQGSGKRLDQDDSGL